VQVLLDRTWHTLSVFLRQCPDLLHGQDRQVIHQVLRVQRPVTFDGLLDRIGRGGACLRAPLGDESPTFAAWVVRLPPRLLDGSLAMATKPQPMAATQDDAIRMNRARMPTMAILALLVPDTASAPEFILLPALRALIFVTRCPRLFHLALVGVDDVVNLL